MVNPMPQIVATFLVSKLISAVLSRIKKMIVMPIGRSIRFPLLVFTRTFSGTSYSRGDLSLNRSTTIASVLNTNDQITPNAYASPSV